MGSGRLYKTGSAQMKEGRKEEGRKDGRKEGKETKHIKYFKSIHRQPVRWTDEQTLTY